MQIWERPLTTMTPLETIAFLSGLLCWQAVLFFLIRNRKFIDRKIIEKRWPSPFGAFIFIQAACVLRLLVDAIHRWLNQ